MSDLSYPRSLSVGYSATTPRGKEKVMPSKSKAPKFTPEQIKEHIKNTAKAVEKHKKENKEKHFDAITPEETEEKLKRVNSPYIMSLGYGGSTPGGTLSFSVGIYNPDPVSFNSLFVSTFVGTGNIDPVLGTFLLNVDTRFATLTAPNNSSGQTLAPSTSATFSYSLPVPATVQKTTYMVNACLFMRGWFETGTYYDRASFALVVS